MLLKSRTDCTEGVTIRENQSRVLNNCEFVCIQSTNLRQVSPSNQTFSSYSSTNNYRFACNIDLSIRLSKKQTKTEAQSGTLVLICPLIKRDSRRDGPAGSLKSLIYSSSGRGGCPAAALVTFSTFSRKVNTTPKQKRRKRSYPLCLPSSNLGLFVTHLSLKVLQITVFVGPLVHPSARHSKFLLR
jgi:hypothetical protein